MHTFLLLLASTVQVIVALPVDSPIKDVQTSQRTSRPASEHLIRPAAGVPSAQSEVPREELKGKRKLVDTSDGLENYLRKEPRRRMSSSVPRKSDATATDASSTLAASRGNTLVPKARPAQAGPSRLQVVTSSARKPANRSKDRHKLKPTAVTEESIISETLVPRRGASGLVHLERQQAFRRAWRDLDCSTKLDPAELADRIMAMRAHGVDPTSSAHLASKIVNAKGNKDYESKYLARTRYLSAYYSEEKRRIEKDKVLGAYNSQTQAKLALEGMHKSMARNEKRKRKIEMSLGVGPIASDKKAAESIEAIGRSVQEAIEAKGLDFSNMSLDDLGKELRKLKKPEEISASQYTRSIYRYIQYHRRMSFDEIEVFKRKHRNAPDKKQRRFKTVQRQSSEQHE